MNYLPNLSIEAFERDFSARFPALAPALWLRRPGGDDVVDLDRAEKNEFESDASGRGDSFRRAHERSSVKATGMSRLLELATGCDQVDQLPDGFHLLDVLGGSGALVRVTRELAKWTTSTDWILTGDVSSLMVRQALDYGLPALRQPAQFLLCADNAFDAVLVAYGAHHIPVPERPTCYAEAFRVLKPGGRLVVHDFEVGSPMARWFEEIVDVYSPTGHQYTHFTRDELEKDLRTAGFASVELQVVYDPITVRAQKPAQARDRLRDYLLNAYRLTPPNGRADVGEVRAWAGGLVADCIRYGPSDLSGLDGVAALVAVSGTVAVYATAQGWVAELPRLALVAVATKAPDGE
jgi:ubiquinone/menaquinone biosynthesis C-methylase UbiE